MRTGPAPALSYPSSWDLPPTFHPLPAGHPVASELLVISQGAHHQPGAQQHQMLLYHLPYDTARDC